MNRQVRCYDCGSTIDFEARKRCVCGEPLWFEVDASGFEWPADGRTDVWRYADVLPVSEPVGISGGAGATPLLRMTRLDGYAGCTLHLKAEGQNPTGSFKDRGSAVGVSYAVDAGKEWVGTVSHGNMALSVSAHAASVGLECAVFVPEYVPEERLEMIARHDPHLLQVVGDYGQLYEDTLSLDLDVEFLNSDTPLRVAGQKTVAYEICETFAPSVPDAIALPVSSGGQASGVWKALLELETAGLIDHVPRLYLVQASACDPIATAFRNDASTVTAVEGQETIAVSIANGDPPSGTRAMRAARETGGSVVSVSDDEIRAAMTRLSTTAGLSVEPSSAAAVAGIRTLSQAGEIDADEDVVAILTGSGYKERVDAEPASRRIELTAIERELARLVGT